YAAELLHDAFVAAIDVVDAVDDGFAAGHQPREDQAGAGAQVGSLHGAARELRGPADHGAAAVDGNVGPHANHFAGVQVAILEDCLGDDGGAFGLRGERHVLRL